MHSSQMPLMLLLLCYMHAVAPYFISIPLSSPPSLLMSIPLGAMPSSLELSSLGLQVSQSNESLLVAASSGVTLSGAGDSMTPLSESTSTSEGENSKAFSLGQGFPLNPAKLVQKIQNWQYIGMAELLPDNLELARCSSESPNVSSCSLKTVRRRELSHDQNGLMAWSVCFSTFAGINIYWAKAPTQTQGAAGIPGDNRH